MRHLLEAAIFHEKNVLIFLDPHTGTEQHINDCEYIIAPQHVFCRIFIYQTTSTFLCFNTNASF